MSRAKYHKILRNQKGFSFIEFMISVGLFTIIMGALYAGLLVGGDSYASYDASSIPQREVRNTLSTMAKDLRMASGLTITSDGSGNTTNLSFVKDGNTITYTWTDTGTDANRIIRDEQGGVIRTIANDISAVVINEGATDITIDVTSYVEAGYDESYTFQLDTKVVKR